MTSRVNAWVPDELHRHLNARGSISDAIRQALSRYFYLLDTARHNISDKFTEPELSLLCDICNGTLWEPRAIPLLFASVEDAEEEYFGKWNVDRKKLLTKLSKLTSIETAALVDAVERFWAASETGMRVNPGDILKTVTIQNLTN